MNPKMCAMTEEEVEFYLDDSDHHKKKDWGLDLQTHMIAGALGELGRPKGKKRRPEAVPKDPIPASAPVSPDDHAQAILEALRAKPHLLAPLVQKLLTGDDSPLAAGTLRVALPWQEKMAGKWYRSELGKPNEFAATIEVEQPGAIDGKGRIVWTWYAWDGSSDNPATGQAVERVDGKRSHDARDVGMSRADDALRNGGWVVL